MKIKSLFPLLEVLYSALLTKNISRSLFLHVRWISLEDTNFVMCVSSAEEKREGAKGGGGACARGNLPQDQGKTRPTPYTLQNELW